MQLKMNQEQTKDALQSLTGDAALLLDDREMTEDKLDAAQRKLYQYKNVPVIGALVYDIVTMVEMIWDYVNKEYRQVPIATMTVLLAAIVYFVSPIDFIPDVIPGIGLLDDAAVIALALRIAGGDLDKYKKWKAEHKQNMVCTADDPVDVAVKNMFEAIPYRVAKSEMVDDLSALKKGDHIYCWRRVYSHHGLYIDDEHVVHYADDPDSHTCIHVVTLAQFRTRLWYDFGKHKHELATVRRRTLKSSPCKFSVDETVARAMSRVGESRYNLVSNNCEDFVIWCRNGEALPEGYFAFNEEHSMNAEDIPVMT